MKKALLTLSVVALTLTTARDAKASSTANTTANATANVVTSIAITKTADLAFGDVAPGDGTKVVATGDAGAAAFTVTGQASKLYTISLPASITVISGANSMTVGTFTTNPALTSGNLGAGGTQALKVGGTLTIGAAQATGSYTGTVTATVTYQ